MKKYTAAQRRALRHARNVRNNQRDKLTHAERRQNKRALAAENDAKNRKRNNRRRSIHDMAHHANAKPEQASAEERAAARPAARKARRTARIVAAMAPKIRAMLNEDRKCAAARPAAIAEVAAAYDKQCKDRKAEKQSEREQRKVKATIPAEAATTETR